MFFGDFVSSIFFIVNLFQFHSLSALILADSIHKLLKLSLIDVNPKIIAQFYNTYSK